MFRVSVFVDPALVHYACRSIIYAYRPPSACLEIFVQKRDHISLCKNCLWYNRSRRFLFECFKQKIQLVFGNKLNPIVKAVLWSLFDGFLFTDNLHHIHTIVVVMGWRCRVVWFKKSKRLILIPGFVYSKNC